MKKVLKEIKVPDNKSEKTAAAEDEDEEDEVSPERGAESSPEKKTESPDKKKEGGGGKKGNKTEGADLMIAEEKQYDKVRISDYVKLFSFSYGSWTIVAFLMQTVFCALIQLFISYFLTYWTGRPFEEQQKKEYPIIFSGSIIFFMLMALLRAQIIIRIISKSAENIHDKMLTHVARAQILFFDSNPVGRILARFSKDVSVVDMQIPALSNLCAQGMFRTITVFTILMVL